MGPSPDPPLDAWACEEALREIACTALELPEEDEFLARLARLTEGHGESVARGMDGVRANDGRRDPGSG